MEIAITVDELLLWDGTPMPSGYTPHTVLDSLLGALSEHDVTGVYGFAHTAPIEDDPANLEILDRWVDAGHHLGNHTHCHACLNWVTGQQYIDDIKRSEEYIGGFVDKAPAKYFRYAMDMSGESERKRGMVEDHLRAEGYVNAPITAWFGDFAWIAPYCRALASGDRAAAHRLRESYIGAAVGQLVAAHETQRRLFRFDVPLIWLIHGTAIAQDCLGEILGRFTELGAEFISLSDAMASPVNRVMSPVSPLFRNHLQRLAAAVGEEVPTSADAEQMAQVLTAALPDGDDPFGVYDDLIHRMAARAGGSIENWSWA